MRRANMHVEMLMLFWKMIEINEKFLQYALETDKTLTIASAILFLACESKSDMTQIGLLRMW